MLLSLTTDSIEIMPRLPSHRLFLLLTSVLAFLPITLSSADEPEAAVVSPEAAVGSSNHADPSGSAVDVLLVTGGCCHDYEFQTKAMQLALKEYGLKVRWTVVNDGGTGTEAEIKLYDSPDWASGFDVVIHNECFAKTTDPEYIRRITTAHHAGVDAIVIHCAMHTYRDAEIDDWRQFLGVTSRRHDHQSRYPVKVLKAEHPIVASIPDGYVSATDELYVIEKTWPNTTILATSQSEKTKMDHPVFWLNRYGQANVFGTTYGHSNDTFEDKVFLEVLCRATEWLSQQH